MKEKTVAGADSIKLLRSSEPHTLVGVSKLGDKPINSSNPIRKKAFYRALKRKELWAIVSYSTIQNDKFLKTILDKFNKVIYEKYCPDDTIYITWPLKGLSEIINRD